MSRLRRGLSLLLSVLILMVGLPSGMVTASAQGTMGFLDGDGTEGNPYQISTTAHLNNVRKYPNAHFRLVKNLEFTEDDFFEGGEFYNAGHGWVPIGTVMTPFSGVFDGGGHTITGLYINISSEEDVYAGLFGYSTRTIQRLNLSGAAISVNVTSSGEGINTDAYAGGIAGYAYGTIRDCRVSDTRISVNGIWAYAGGVIGSNRSAVDNCHTVGCDVRAQGKRAYAGGIMGWNERNIALCSSTCSITAQAVADYYAYAYAGGIVGNNRDGNISDCYNTGSVIIEKSTYYAYAGGIAGYFQSDRPYPSLSRCYNTGAISASGTDNSAGGIVGECKDDILDCYNTGSVTVISSTSASSKNSVGGIAGHQENFGGTIERCYNIGVINDHIFPFSSRARASTYTGGIIGYGETNNKDCYYLDIVNKGVFTGTDNATKCTAEQLKQQAVFEGFDFTSTWEFVPGNSYPYPTLRTLSFTDVREENTTEFLGGRGTPYDPYRISTTEHLNNVRKYPDAHFKLMGHIVFTDSDFSEGGEFYNSGQGWDPIGTAAEPFTGVFDGGEHTITGLYIKRSSEETMYAGLFGYNEGVIQNLGITDGTLSVDALLSKDGKASVYACAGSIAGHNGGIVRGCWNTSLVTASAAAHLSNQYYSTYAYAGGIAGVNTGSIIDCSNTDAVSAFSSPTSRFLMSVYAGGIAGRNNCGDILACYNTGSVSAGALALSTFAYAGGVAGDNIGAVRDCYNTGSVTSKGEQACTGGITGSNYSTVENAYNSGELTAEVDSAHTGGITGSNGSSGVVSNSYYLDTVSAGSGTGMDTGVQCTDEQLQQQATFEGFDFTAVWEIDSYHEYPYPQLKNNRQEAIDHLEIVTQPANNRFVEGLQPDLAGAAIIIVYADGFEVTIQPTIQMLQGLDTGKVGIQESFLRYGGQVSTGTLRLEVLSKSIVNMSIQTPPEKTTYVQGQPLNLTGSEMLLQYDNHTTAVVSLNQAKLSYDAKQIGTVTVTAEYEGFTDSFTITVHEKQVQSIDVNGPDKQSYIEGQELDLTGGKLLVTYVSEDGYTEEFPLDPSMISGYDRNKLGPQNLTVTYGEKTCLLTVTVVAKSLTGIAITQQPTKLTYLEGEAFDTSGMVVTASYNNGTSENVTGYQVSGYSPTPGVKTITVSYQGKTASFTVTVRPRSLTHIAIEALPHKTVYMAGEALELSGLDVWAWYDNHEGEPIDGYSVSGYDPNRIGEQTVTVSYEGKSAAFTVTVQSRVPESITSSAYAVSDGSISKISAGTTASTLLNGINEKAYCKVYKGNTEISGNTPVGTGMVVKLLDGSTVKQTLTIVVTGDINGDGGITITDMLAVKSHLLKKSTLSGAVGKAADTSGDKAISITDFIQIKAHILGKDKIQPKAC